MYQYTNTFPNWAKLKSLGRKMVNAYNKWHPKMTLINFDSAKFPSREISLEELGLDGLDPDVTYGWKFIGIPGKYFVSKQTKADCFIVDEKDPTELLVFHEYGYPVNSSSGKILSTLPDKKYHITAAVPPCDYGYEWVVIPIPKKEIQLDLFK